MLKYLSGPILSFAIAPLRHSCLFRQLCNAMPLTPALIRMYERNLKRIKNVSILNLGSQYVASYGWESLGSLGVFAGAGIGLIGAPLARFFLPGDPATAATATRLFGWAALSAPLVCPTVLLEASLLGAGRSYKFLASMTLANALGLGAATHLALRLRPDPTTAWVCIISFFALRVTPAKVTHLAHSRAPTPPASRRRPLPPRSGGPTCPSTP